MPIRFLCPACKIGVKAPDDKGGLRVKCPQCGAMMEVPVSKGVIVEEPSIAPSAPAASDWETSPPPIRSIREAPSPPDPDLASMLEPPESESGGVSSPSVPTAGEPWYYGYCYTATIFLLYFQIALIVLGLIAWIGLGLLGATQARNTGQHLAAYFLSSALMLFCGLLASLYLLYAFSFVLVFIDAARHVRRIHQVLAKKDS